MAISRATVMRRSRVEHLRSSRTFRKTTAFYMFISPWLLGFIFVFFIPFAVGFLTSLSNYDGLNFDTVKFVGFRNYARAVKDPDTLFTFGRSALWSALNTPAWLITAFTMALILNQAVKGRDFFRTVYYLPSVIPIVATSRMALLFFDTNNGLLNGILSLFSPGLAVRWITDYSLLSLTTISVWQGLGSGMIIFLAGLQGIPMELEEAAQIDGANKALVFRHITIPMMTPVIFFQLIMGLISSLQAFAMPMLVYGQGKLGTVPPREVYLYVVNTYMHIFGYQRFGYGTALLWMLFIVILTLTTVVFRSAPYWVHYEEAVEGARE